MYHLIGKANCWQLGVTVNHVPRRFDSCLPSMENKSKFTVPWALIMTFVLLVIKIMWVPALSWWLVFLPVLIVAGFLVGVLLIVGFVAWVVSWLDS